MNWLGSIAQLSYNYYDVGLGLGSLYTHSITYNKYTCDKYINYETQIYMYSCKNSYLSIQLI